MIRTDRARGLAGYGQPAYEPKPYRFQGRPGWTPEGVGPLRRVPSNKGARLKQAGRAARMPVFTAAREAGKSVAEVSAEAGIAPGTGRSYEAERKRNARAAAVAGASS